MKEQAFKGLSILVLKSYFWRVAGLFNEVFINGEIDILLYNLFAINFNQYTFDIFCTDINPENLTHVLETCLKIWNRLLQFQMLKHKCSTCILIQILQVKIY